MRVLYAYLFVFCTHIYAFFYAHICVFCTHIHASKRHIYMHLKCLVKIDIVLEPIYHELVFKQMANHITLGNGFVNRDSTYPSSQIRQSSSALHEASHCLSCSVEMYMRWLKISKRPNGGNALKSFTYSCLKIADLLFQHHE